MRLEALAYPGTEARDLRLDFLRGIAVLAMVVDHLAGPSVLYLLTGGNRFFTSAAEAFVLISGVVTGQVYGRIAERESLGAALRRLLGRAWSLYLLTLGLTMIALLFGRAESGGSQEVTERTPLELLWSILTLHQTAYLVDVPLLYTLLLLVAPLALLLMHEGRTWIVVLGSAVLWAGHQLFAGHPDIPWSIAGNHLFHFAAWQVLFFLGMVLGYHRAHLRARISRIQEWRLLLAGAVAFAALVVAFGLLQLGSDTSRQSDRALALMLQERVFAKSDLQIGRLLASAMVLGFLFLLVTRFWVPLRKGLGWLLLPLGQNALYAYTAHTALALVLPLVLPLAATQAGSSTSEWSGNLSALVQVSGLALIWVAVRFRLLFPTAATRRWWMLIPVPLSAVMLLPFGHEAPQTAPPVALAQTSSDDAGRLARVFGTPIPRLQARDPAGDRRVAPAAAELVTPAASVSPPASSPSPVSAESISRPWSLVSAIGARIHGSFRESSFHSSALDREMSYYIYVPPHDAAETRRYPALYMLHGGSGSKDEWPTYGLIDAVDRLIATSEISPMIVVLPQGDLGYWVNQANDGPRWGDYLAYDVVNTVDRTAPTLADRDHRAVAGLSMGGAGALQIAFNHPDVFRIVGAHSPSLHLDDGTFPILGTGAVFAGREPLTLAAQAEGIDALDIWIDAGDQDPWLERDEMLHQALVERGIVHHWSVLSGGHEGPYWQHNLETYLRSYNAALDDRDTSSASRAR